MVFSQTVHLGVQLAFESRSDLHVVLLFDSFQAKPGEFRLLLKRCCLAEKNSKKICLLLGMSGLLKKIRFLILTYERKRI